MFVSVVIPTYNRSESLKRAIQSVLNQTYSKFELIVVDDGSTDSTQKWLKTYDSKIQVLRQSNKGVSAARNRGILESKGELVAFLDSDDAWHPKKLDTQVRFFKEHPKAFICQTEEEWIRDGRSVNPMKKHAKYSGRIFQKCLALCIVSPSAVMMKRSLLDQVGLFDETLPACEDYDLWLRVASRFPIYLIEGYLTIKYGGHSDQLSRTVPHLDKYRIQAMVKLLDSGALKPKMRDWTLGELARKCKIYGEGCLKHSRIEEGKAILDLPKKYGPLSSL